MLTASGANFGFMRTVPHMLGICFGFLGLTALSAFGLNIIFEAYPKTQWMLKLLGTAYLFFLAWKIAGSGQTTDDSGSGKKPISFVQAAIFQFLNPKALFIAVTAISVYTLSGRDYRFSVIIVMAVFFITCLLSVSVWTVFGTVIGKFLANSKIRKTFNYIMGILTAGSAVMILI